MNSEIPSSGEDELYRVRHSLAHIMAQAVLELRPGSKLGFGPPIEDGFYYDFLLSSPLSEQDFATIENTMRRLISEDSAFIREELPLDAALERLETMGEPYKKEYARELAGKYGKRSLSFYRSGEFMDMCEGPHVQRSGEIPLDCFKLRSIAGAYWRGDSRGVMMTRIYAWALENKEALVSHISAYELALQRDHKKLGKELEIFEIDEEIGRGLPLWLPNGAAIREELEKFLKELEFKAGYHRVATPPLARSDLYRRTGHLPYFEGNMYPQMTFPDPDTESYHLRPMNCPHHHKIFSARPRSYRDLPFRIAEFGQVYRLESSGSLSGILRVRGMCQNDAHLYCSEDQVIPELRAVLEMYREVYDVLDISGYRMRLSLGDSSDPHGREKYVDDADGWRRSENLLREVLHSEGMEYFEAKGEAAFYGPKIDIQMKSVTGREETASTIQLDFAMAKRLGLKYIGADNKEHHPYIIHRAPLGTHERMIAFLLEHYGGAFPTWLAPIQVRILPISDRFSAYAEEVCRKLRDRLIRAELDRSPDTLQKKIRNASLMKIPNLLVIGQRELKNGEVTLRIRGKKDQVSMSVGRFLDWISSEIRQKKRA